jgi:hypothetical protein
MIKFDSNKYDKNHENSYIKIYHMHNWKQTFILIKFNLIIEDNNRYDDDN